LLTLLAGRKLLLADDSITIQKVVDLTFADEGVEVVSVANGKQALERIEEVAPDIVLADVHMPEMNGYQVCEYIKENEKLRHIPVMLLIGSFEPFDEAEARRVGADDTLSKPFQSIRRLVDRVSSLLGSKQADHELQGALDQEAPTAELPTSVSDAAEAETLSTAELNVSTADTRPLPEEVKTLADASAKLAQGMAANSSLAVETRTNGRNMESSFTDLKTKSAATSEAGEVLLDLGEFDSADQILSDEFVLDLDLETSSEPLAPALESVETTESEVAESAAMQWGGVEEEPETPVAEETVADEVYTTHAMAQPAPQEANRKESRMHEATLSEPPLGQSHDMNEVGGRGRITLDQLAPEVIDAIARRAVEHLSHKVVEDIAWEVVPELSELLIKHQLEKTKG
jgi:CheY-like chemotaxis protein